MLIIQRTPSQRLPLPTLLLATLATLTPTSSTQTGWTRHAGLNCFDQGQDLEEPKGSSAGVMSLKDCQRMCMNTTGCDGVVRDVLNLTWAVHASTNCYQGHGATDLADGIGSPDDCQTMTEAECRTQCYLTPGCTGMTYSQDGYCCLRADISLSECDNNYAWATQVLLDVQPGAQNCYRRGNLTVLACDAESEEHDTYLLGEFPQTPWWLSTHFAERSFMPRHFACSSKNATCTFNDLRDMLPEVQAQGYSVINVDWPVESGPDPLYEGFGVKDFYNVDPLLGTLEEWTALVDAAHALDLKVIADFNPSYFWTGAPTFQRALDDVRLHGLPDTSSTLPADSPARWFRWAANTSAECAGASWTQPLDEAASDGFVDDWVVASPSSGGHCYWSVWGNGQPAADLAQAEWRQELGRVLAFWVGGPSGLDGVLLDAPPFYLANGTGPNDGLHDSDLAAVVRATVVEPLHALGVAVFGETYNFQRATVTKMLDGARNTDMYDGTTLGFPGLLHDMVVSGNATGLEALLARTVDTPSAWCGTVRTQPDSRIEGASSTRFGRGGVSRGRRDDAAAAAAAAAASSVGALKAAATALLAGYYVVRFGPVCDSPYAFTPPSAGPGDEWPGGCFGAWAAAEAVAPTLKALRAVPALHPGTPRTALPVTSNVTSSSASSVSSSVSSNSSNAEEASGAYAALRVPRQLEVESGADTNPLLGQGLLEAAVVVLNMAAEPALVTIDLSRVVAYSFNDDPQRPVDLIHGGYGPAITHRVGETGPRSSLAVELPARGWAAFAVKCHSSMCGAPK